MTGSENLARHPETSDYGEGLFTEQPTIFCVVGWFLGRSAWGAKQLWPKPVCIES